MRRPLSLVIPLCLILQSSGIAGAATMTPTPAPTKSPAAKAKVKLPSRAPADEYFGRQKLSILGVRNQLHDLSIRYDGTVQRAPMVMTVGGDVEEAMRAWSKKYRGDLWLAHEMFRLDEIYMRVPTDEGRKRMNDLTYIILHDYPGTFYAKYLTKIRKEAKQKEALAKIDPSSSPSPGQASSATPAGTSTAQTAQTATPKPVATAKPSATVKPTMLPTVKPAESARTVTTPPARPTATPTPAIPYRVLPSPAVVKTAAPIRTATPVPLQTFAPAPAKTELPDYLQVPKELQQ